MTLVQNSWMYALYYSFQKHYLLLHYSNYDGGVLDIKDYNSQVFLSQILFQRGSAGRGILLIKFKYSRNMKSNIGWRSIEFQVRKYRYQTSDASFN